MPLHDLNHTLVLSHVHSISNDTVHTKLLPCIALHSLVAEIFKMLFCVRLFGDTSSKDLMIDVLEQCGGDVEKARQKLIDFGLQEKAPQSPSLTLPPPRAILKPTPSPTANVAPQALQRRAGLASWSGSPVHPRSGAATPPQRTSVSGAVSSAVNASALANASGAYRNMMSAGAAGTSAAGGVAPPAFELVDQSAALDDGSGDDDDSDDMMFAPGQRVTYEQQQALYQKQRCVYVGKGAELDQIVMDIFHCNTAQGQLIPPASILPA